MTLCNILFVSNNPYGTNVQIFDNIISTLGTRVQKTKINVTKINQTDVMVKPTSSSLCLELKSLSNIYPPRKVTVLEFSISGYQSYRVDKITGLPRSDSTLDEVTRKRRRPVQQVIGGNVGVGGCNAGGVERSVRRLSWWSKR